LVKWKFSAICQLPGALNKQYWRHLLGCPQFSLLLHFCSQVGMESRQLDRFCLSARDIFPQGQYVTLSGESSQSGQGPRWHFRLQRWFPHDSFLSHIPPQGKYFEAEDSLVHGTSRITFPQWHSAEKYHTISRVLRFCHSTHSLKTLLLYTFVAVMKQIKTYRQLQLMDFIAVWYYICLYKQQKMGLYVIQVCHSRIEPIMCPLFV
jgi:hypothetical protein